VNATQLLAIGGGLGAAGGLWALAIIVVHLRAGRVHPPTLSTLAHRHHQARQLALAGDHAAAERHYRLLRIAHRRIHGTRNITAIHTQHQLARSLAQQGKYHAAEREYRSSLHARVRLLGPEHLSVFVARLQIARMQVMQGKLKQAEKEYRHLLADQTRVLGTAHPDTQFTQEALQNLLEGKRRIDQVTGPGPPGGRPR